MIDSKKNDITTRRTNLISYLNRGTFEIPLYQRDFVWNKDNIREFLEELYYLFEKSNKEEPLEMFVGSTYIALNPHTHSWEIIDGQQRTVLFYCLKFYFLDDIKNKKHSIEELFKKYESIIKERFEKLDEPERDDDILLVEDIMKIKKILKKFEIVSLNDDFGVDFPGSNASLKKGYKAVFEWFEKNLVENSNINNIAKNFEFIKFIFSQISLIDIQTKPKDNINEIFKSINSKGRSLSQWDLIRNEIYQDVLLKHPLNKDTAQEKLQEIDYYLALFNDKWYIKPEQFIWSYTIFKKQKFVSQNSLAKEFSILLRKRDAEKIDLSAMIEDIKSFYVILEKLDKNVNQYKWFLYICGVMGAKQVKTVILSVFMANNFDNYNLWMEKLLINFVVFVSVNGGRSNFFFKFFNSPDTILILMKNDEKEIVDLLEKKHFYEENKKVKFLNRNDEIFMKNIYEKLSDMKNLIKVYIFIKTWNQKKLWTFPMLVYEYEHVLPKSYGLWKTEYPYWGNISNKDFSNYIEQVGNFILLNKELNIQASNSLLEDKFKEYYPKDQNSEYSIFCRGLDLNEECYKFLIPLFGDFSNKNEPPKFTPELIEKRTREISDKFIDMFIEKL